MIDPTRVAISDADCGFGPPAADFKSRSRISNPPFRTDRGSVFSTAFGAVCGLGRVGRLCRDASRCPRCASPRSPPRGPPPRHAEWSASFRMGRWLGPATPSNSERATAAAIDQLHRVSNTARILADGVDAHDVGVIEPGGGLGLTQEPQRSSPGSWPAEVFRPPPAVETGAPHRLPPIRRRRSGLISSNVAELFPDARDEHPGTEAGTDPPPVGSRALPHYPQGVTWCLPSHSARSRNRSPNTRHLPPLLEGVHVRLTPHGHQCLVPRTSWRSPKLL
jgi:hypothetical protein